MLKFNRIFALALLAGSSTTVMAQEEEKREIIVTARSLQDTRADLKACLARRCPPDEDIKASIAHAENQFVEGDYRDARETLVRSLGRNRRHKAQFPVELSDLLRANGNVASHLGEADAYRLSVLDMRDILKSALQPNDYRMFGAEIEVADSRMKLGYLEEAKDKYLAIQKEALAKGLPQVAAMAKLRQLSLLVQVADSQKTAFARKEANDAINAYLATPAAGAEQFKIAAEVMQSRMDRSAGNSQSTDRLVARYAALGGTDRPVLIHANPIKMNDAQAARAAAGGSDLNRRNMQVVDRRWVDIGFWINADGKVEEPEIIRKQGNSDWTDVVIRSIRSRIYAPLRSEKNGVAPGIYAVERYTLTAQFEDDVTGTHIRQRSPVAKIERIDLTG